MHNKKDPYVCLGQIFLNAGRFGITLPKIDGFDWEKLAHQVAYIPYVDIPASLGGGFEDSFQNKPQPPVFTPRQKAKFETLQRHIDQITPDIIYRLKQLEVLDKDPKESMRTDVFYNTQYNQDMVDAEQTFAAIGIPQEQKINFNAPSEWGRMLTALEQEKQQIYKWVAKTLNEYCSPTTDYYYGVENEVVDLDYVSEKSTFTTNLLPTTNQIMDFVYYPTSDPNFQSNIKTTMSLDTVQGLATIEIKTAYNDELMSKLEYPVPQDGQYFIDTSLCSPKSTLFYLSTSGPKTIEIQPYSIMLVLTTSVNRICRVLVYARFDVDNPPPPPDPTTSGGILTLYNDADGNAMTCHLKYEFYRTYDVPRFECKTTLEASEWIGYKQNYSNFFPGIPEPQLYTTAKGTKEYNKTYVTVLPISTVDVKTLLKMTSVESQFSFGITSKTKNQTGTEITLTVNTLKDIEDQYLEPPNGLVSYDGNFKALLNLGVNNEQLSRLYNDLILSKFQIIRQKTQGDRHVVFFNITLTGTVDVINNIYENADTFEGFRIIHSSQDGIPAILPDQQPVVSSYTINTRNVIYTDTDTCDFVIENISSAEVIEMDNTLGLTFSNIPKPATLVQ